MANIKSAKKKTRVIKRKTSINRIRIGKYKSAVSEIEKAIKSKDLNKAKKLFNNFQSVLMKTSKKDLSKENCLRKISRISKNIF